MDAIRQWLFDNTAVVIQYIAVALIGMAVGVGELVSRYKDAPAKAIGNIYGVYYIGLNATAAVLALLAVRAMGLKFGLGQENTVNYTQALLLVQALGSGFGAMTLFRSSAFIARVGDQDVAIGPSAFLMSIMSAVDREVDRFRAEQRATSVRTAMAGIDFQTAHQALPILAVSLMQNLPEEDSKKLDQDMERLRKDQSLPDNAKSLCMGLALINVVGEDVLNAAVDALKASLAAGGDASKVPEVPAPSQGGVVSSMLNTLRSWRSPSASDAAEPPAPGEEPSPAEPREGPAPSPGVVASTATEAAPAEAPAKTEGPSSGAPPT